MTPRATPATLISVRIGRWRIFDKTRLSISSRYVASVRHQGFTGDFIPLFRFRFAPTAEERVAALQAQPRETPQIATDELTVSPSDWPQFRGPQRDGIVRAVTIRRDWEANPPQALWKHAIGPGWSSFAVVSGLAFTQEQRGDDEAVTCYDVKTGAPDVGVGVMTHPVHVVEGAVEVELEA